MKKPLKKSTLSSSHKVVSKRKKPMHLLLDSCWGHHREGRQKLRTASIWPKGGISNLSEITQSPALGHWGWLPEKWCMCNRIISTSDLVHSKKSHTNQLGFSYSKALRSINLFQSSRCLLFEIWVIFCYFSEVHFTYMNFVLIWLGLCILSHICKHGLKWYSNHLKNHNKGPY